MRGKFAEIPLGHAVYRTRERTAVAERPCPLLTFPRHRGRSISNTGLSQGFRYIAPSEREMHTHQRCQSATVTNKATASTTFRLRPLGDAISLTVRLRNTARTNMRTAAQTAVWTWIILATGWLAIVVWVAITEPIDGSVPWVYAMTAIVPPGSLLAFGAVLIWMARAFHRYISPTG